MLNSYISFPVGSNLHYYGSGSILQVKFQKSCFNKIATDILILCNGKNRIKDIVDKLIVSTHHLPTQDQKRTIQENVLSFVSSCCKKSFLVTSDKPISGYYSITGERGKYYPRKITLELTNTCNLRCKHCFKNAGVQTTIHMGMDVIDYLCENFSSQVYEVQLSGGEPFCHPEITTILEKLLQHFRVSIVTNGTLMEHINDEVLKKIRRIQVSLYGYDKEIFSKITNTSGYLFENVGAAISRSTLSHENQVTIILNDIVVNNLENYIRYAIKHGAKEIKFAISSPLGRALDSSDIEWDSNIFDLDAIQEELALLHEKYKELVNVIVWTEEEEDKSGIYDIISDVIPYCGAGFLDYCITERGMLKTCQLLTEDFELGNYKELEERCLTLPPTQDDIFKNYAASLQLEALDPCSICSYLRKFTGS